MENVWKTKPFLHKTTASEPKTWIYWFAVICWLFPDENMNKNSKNSLQFFYKFDAGWYFENISR